jgi:RimJ/RimL family protein N-acetyltransferase
MVSDSAKTPQPPRKLSAGPIDLRAMRESDWELEQALSHDAEVVRWTFYPEAMDETAARHRVSVSVERAGSGGFQRYVIWHGNDAVGTCGLAHLDTDCPEVMYVLLPSSRGQGFATRAALALVGWTTGARYGAVRLETVEGNSASERVAQRAGFTVLRSGLDEHRGSTVTVHIWERILNPDRTFRSTQQEGTPHSR